jgi:DNA-binding transcriptional LysR family regulator
MLVVWTAEGSAARLVAELLVATRPLEPPYDRQLRSEVLYQDPLVAVLPAGHRLAGRPIQLAKLADERFVMCDRSAAPRFFDKFMALCAQAGFVPKIAQTSNLLSILLTLVQAGEGVTLIPGSLPHFRFSDLAFCPLTRPTGAIELVMAWSPEREDVLLTLLLREEEISINLLHTECPRHIAGNRDSGDPEVASKSGAKHIHRAISFVRPSH